MSIIDIIYLLWTIVPNELILFMLQWINIVDSVTNTIQKPVVWTRVFIYQFGRHHGGCAVCTTSKSLYGSEICRNALINEDPCSNHGLLDGVGNIINNVYSLKYVKYDKDEFIRYNCSQQIDNVNNTHLLGCCLSWSRIVNTELGKSVA